MSAKTTTQPKPPFWQSANKPAPRPRSRSYAALVAAGVAARPYSKSGLYAVGDLVEHARYGIGLVTELPARGKVAVLCADRSRLLMCVGTR